MEYIFYILSALVSISFLLKVGFYQGYWKWVICIIAAISAWYITPWITEQPHSMMTEFLSSRPILLNISVCIMIESAIMIAYCFDCFAAYRNRTSIFNRIVTIFLHCYPGLLVGGVICLAISNIIYSVPGINFDLLSWIVALATFIITATGIWLLRLLSEEKAIRLELLFIVNLFIIILNIIIIGY